MKWILMYAAVLYVVACADDTGTQEHTSAQRALRALFWPLTLTSWFRSNNQRLHKLLTILWTVLVLGWVLSLMSDRL